jgi:hypothetical protein
MMRTETLAGGGGGLGRSIMAHAFAWSGAALAEAGSMLHAGWRGRIRIRILRAMLRSGLLGGISGRDEEVAAALRVCARQSGSPRCARHRRIRRA